MANHNPTLTQGSSRLPSKQERHRLFGSVDPIPGNKPTEKEKMVDLQNTPKDFLFSLDQVGISSVKHPAVVHSTLNPTVQTTVANFALTTSLVQNSKGINMSRLTEQLDLYHQQGWDLSLKHLCQFAEELAGRMKQSAATIEVTFPWFYERPAPVTGMTGLMHAEAMMRVHFDEVAGFTATVGLKAMVTTLCPCSKEISEYSAHNQRGVVTAEIELVDAQTDWDWKKALLEAEETNASACMHPILKRPDEKKVTESAYENPRFVEDMVRLVAADLYEMPEVAAFFVECRNEESIHLHDAIARVRYRK